MTRSNATLDSLTQAQSERLAFVDLRLFFTGEVGRADLEGRFGIATAAASRDLACYRALAPQNLAYDASAKAYRLGDAFTPLFVFSTARILAWLRQGFGDGLDLTSARAIESDSAGLLSPPSLDRLGVLARAMHVGQALRVSYLSLSSGAAKRDIVPLAFVDNGLRWHVRAYDRKNARFRDFVINRIVQMQPSPAPRQAHEVLSKDTQWQRLLDLELVAHPGLAHPEAVAADYGLKDDLLTVPTRAALAGYALARWNVDCSPEHELAPQRHHLWLRNSQILEGVDSAALAPGHVALRATAN